MKRIRSLARDLLPPGLVSAYDRYREAKLNDHNRGLTTEEVFTEIYANNLWGGGAGTFHSGDGSTAENIVSEYITGIRAELGRIGAASMTAIDLGCGDFRIGRQLANACGRYIGVDIVAPLIEHNQATYGNEIVSFLHANMVTDSLPAGDICFVRQVFQHLSNEQISAVLPKLARYRWSFVTEHHPSPARLRKRNLDKPHGSNIRVARGSGVFLESPPFNVPADRYRLLLEVPAIAAPGGRDPGVIRTYVMELS
jgi:hypothetical protein